MHAVDPVVPSCRRQLAAVLVAAAVALATLGLVAPPSASADASGAVIGGYLYWGIKASFRSYITGQIANGSITPADGASDNSNGTYRFPATGGSHDHASGTTATTHMGSLRFVGHGGALDLTLSDLRIEATGSTGVLRAAVVAKNQGTGNFHTYTDIELALLDLSSVTPVATTGGWSWTVMPASLTSAGSTAFGGFYPPGTAMDPVSFALDLGTSQTTTTVAPTTSAPTTSPSSTTTAVINPTIAVKAAPRFAG